ncbi:hypothetical protein JAAARDRAFT_194875 [Jaapia argillacea MUCL 33604]|uniref:Uncharacterized protein n=1 Tax=Jaapia argillacea MUCL 33604 TaxID=933084 RepID=A0A067PQW7_9AGAM|nr:hypothetical protein JAAARDRAFT_194875 [Jaapia argillacea MUCL 33604]
MEGGNVKDVSFGSLDEVQDEDAVELDDELVLQQDNQSFEIVRARVEEFTEYYKTKELQGAEKMINASIKSCWACGDVSDIIVCLGCQARLCLARAPTSSGCLLPLGGFNRNLFLCPLCHMLALTFPLYEILHTKYERYVFQKRITPTIIITLNYAEEFRFNLSILHWLNLTLASNMHKGDMVGNEEIWSLEVPFERASFRLLHIRPKFFNTLPDMTGTKGSFFLTCGPLMSVSSSCLALEDLVKMCILAYLFTNIMLKQVHSLRNHFSCIITFCGGSVILSNIVLNLAKTVTNSIIYTTNIYSTVETGFAADMRALIHTPITVITKHIKHIADNTSKNDKLSTAVPKLSLPNSIDATSAPSIDQLSSRPSSASGSSKLKSKNPKSRYPLKSKTSLSISIPSLTTNPLSTTAPSSTTPLSTTPSSTAPSSTAPSLAAPSLTTPSSTTITSSTITLSTAPSLTIPPTIAKTIKVIETHMLVFSNSHMCPYGIPAPPCPSLDCKQSSLHVYSRMKNVKKAYKFQWICDRCRLLTDWQDKPAWVMLTSTTYLCQHYWIPYPVPRLQYIWKSGEERETELNALQAAAKLKQKADKAAWQYNHVHGVDHCPCWLIIRGMIWT